MEYHPGGALHSGYAMDMTGSYARVKVTEPFPITRRISKQGDFESNQSVDGTPISRRSPANDLNVVLRPPELTDSLPPSPGTAEFLTKTFYAKPVKFTKALEKKLNEGQSYSDVAKNLGYVPDKDSDDDLSDVESTVPK